MQFDIKTSNAYANGGKNITLIKNKSKNLKRNSYTLFLAFNNL